MPILKDIRTKTTSHFFSGFCFEVHRSMLCVLKSSLLPLTENDVLSFVQVLRVKYAFNEVLAQMLKEWRLNTKEVIRCSQSILIQEMVQLSLSDTHSLRASLKHKYKDQQSEIAKAIRVIVQARSNNRRASSAANLL